jgi:hypothetical protein
MVNILSMVNMIAKYRVTYDSHNGKHLNQFCVHKDDGGIQKFQQSRRGLYYLDTATTENRTVLAITTLEANKSKYTKRDYSRTKLARKIQTLVGRPKLADFIRYLDGNSIPKCPVHRQDAINAHAIFGRDVRSLKGKITQQQLQAILGPVANNLPESLWRTTVTSHYALTSCLSTAFLFLMSISKKIRFITAQVLDNRKLSSLVNTLRRIYGVYRKRGFHITNIPCDREFECTGGVIATDLRSKLNICGEDEHVSAIERCIRTTKERTRCTYNSTPIEHYPPRMIIEMVFLSIIWLNAFPHRLGVLQMLSPRMIVTGLHIDYTKHCRVAFGQYTQTHKKDNNSMEARTIGALALRPTGNAQGGYYFYSLLSGQRLHRTHWTELPMPAKVKDRVHALACQACAHRSLTFTNSDGNNLDTLFPVSDDDNDSDYDPYQDDQASYASWDDSDYGNDNGSAPSAAAADDASVDNPTIINPNLSAVTPGAITGVDDGKNAPTTNTTNPVETPGVDDKTTGVDEVNDKTTGVDGVNNKEDEDDLETYVNELEAELDKEIAALDSNYDPAQHKSDVELDDNITPVDKNKIDTTHADAARKQTSADNDVHDDDDSDDEQSDEDNAPLPKLCQNRIRSFKHLKGRDGNGSLPTIARPHKFSHGKHQAHVILQSIIFTQYNLKQGIRKFGDDGKAAVLVELQQLYNQNVMSPVDKYDLTAKREKVHLDT